MDLRLQDTQIERVTESTAHVVQSAPRVDGHTRDEFHAKLTTLIDQNPSFRGLDSDVVATKLSWHLNQKPNPLAQNAIQIAWTADARTADIATRVTNIIFGKNGSAPKNNGAKAAVSTPEKQEEAAPLSPDQKVKNDLLAEVVKVRVAAAGHPSVLAQVEALERSVQSMKGRDIMNGAAAVRKNLEKQRKRLP